MRGPVLGVVCEPRGEPLRVATRLAQELPGSRGGWTVRVSRRRLPLTEDTRNADLLAHLNEVREQNGWDAVLCVVDVPMRHGRQPIVADANSAHATAVLSLPALGAMRLRRRVREITGWLMQRLGAGAGSDGDKARPQEDRVAGGPFSRITPDTPGIDLRVLATRGRQRLLVGMVRANRPWRLIFGLTSALAAAMAIGAYVLINPSVWKLALALGPPKLAAATVFAVGLMVSWLILDHHLWTRRSQSRRARLYNAATVITLLIGVMCMYAGIFVVVLAASTFTMDPGYFQQNVGRALQVSDLFTVCWLATSLAVVAGALGTGFESLEDVREAAYSYRERERRSALDRRAERERDRCDDDSAAPENMTG